MILSEGTAAPRRWHAAGEDAPRREVVGDGKPEDAGGSACGGGSLLRQKVTGNDPAKQPRQTCTGWGIYSVQSTQRTAMLMLWPSSYHKTTEWIWGSQEAAVAGRAGVFLPPLCGFRKTILLSSTAAPLERSRRGCSAQNSCR